MPTPVSAKDIYSSLLKNRPNSEENNKTLQIEFPNKFLLSEILTNNAKILNSDEKVLEYTKGTLKYLGYDDIIIGGESITNSLDNKVCYIKTGTLSIDSVSNENNLPDILTPDDNISIPIKIENSHNFKLNDNKISVGYLTSETTPINISEVNYESSIGTNILQHGSKKIDIDTLDLTNTKMEISNNNLKFSYGTQNIFKISNNIVISDFPPANSSVEQAFVYDNNKINFYCSSSFDIDERTKNDSQENPQLIDDFLFVKLKNNEYIEYKESNETSITYDTDHYIITVLGDINENVNLSSYLAGGSNVN